MVIIDSVDEMSLQASNALLKLLEEPPPSVLFLLIAHGLGNALPTVRSRACLLSFFSIEGTFSDAEDDFFLKLMGGSPGQAMTLKQVGGVLLWQKVLQALLLIEKREFGRLHTFAQSVGKSDKKIFDKTEEYETILLLILAAIRQTILEGVDPVSILREEDRSVLQSLQKLHSLETWGEVWITLQRFLETAKRSHLDRVHLLMAVFFIVQDPLRGGDFFYG